MQPADANDLLETLQAQEFCGAIFLIDLDIKMLSWLTGKLRGLKAWWTYMLIIAALIPVFVAYLHPSQTSCRALTQSYGDLPLTGNSKTPSLTLTYYEFRLYPCYTEVREKLAAAEASQKEALRLHDAEKAEKARRKAIWENHQATYPNQAAWEAAEAASAKELARLQEAEPCRTTLKAEAEGRANFLQMTTLEQRKLSELILKNSDSCR